MPTFTPVNGRTAGGGGGGGAGAAPGWDFIERVTIGAPTNIFDFAAVLDSDTEQMYKLMGYLRNGNGAPVTYDYRLNGATASGPGLITLRFDDTTAVISSGGIWSLWAGGGQSLPDGDVLTFETTFWMDQSAGQERRFHQIAYQTGFAGIGDIKRLGDAAAPFVANVTSMGIVSSGGAGIGTGSYFTLYKLRQV